MNEMFECYDCHRQLPRPAYGQQQVGSRIVRHRVCKECLHDRMRKLRAHRVANHLCYQCGADLGDDTHSHCLACRIKHRKWRHKDYVRMRMELYEKLPGKDWLAEMRKQKIWWVHPEVEVP